MNGENKKVEGYNKDGRIENGKKWKKITGEEEERIKTGGKKRRRKNEIKIGGRK